MKKNNSKAMHKTLNHQIIIQENILNEVENEQWEKKFITYANIKPICDSKFVELEGLNFGHVMSESFFLFRLRFIKNIRLNMRISFKERNFEIKRIININEQDKILNIIALEI